MTVAATRHPATEKIWHWLEKGSGRDKSWCVRIAVRQNAEALDRLFLDWDKEYADTAGERTSPTTEREACSEIPALSGESGHATTEAAEDVGS